MRGLEVPERTEDFTADPVELFFDLAFVFAFSQLVAHLVPHPTWRVASEAALLFLIVWSAWTTFTWAANAVSGNARPVRVFFLIATATTVPMGASVTKAYGAGGATFAICGAVIILMAIGLQLFTSETGSDEYRAAVTYALPNVLAMALLVAGGLVDGVARSVLWILVVAVIWTAMILAGSGEWIVRTGHFAERHGLIVIIALGEVVVAIGIAVVGSLGDDGLPDATILALVAAGVMAGLLWWGYFDRVLPALEHRSEALAGVDRVKFARDVYSWMHIPIVAGVIAAAAASEEILLHPTDPAPAEVRLLFAAGIALFFGGIALSVLRAFRAFATERAVALATIVALAIVARSWDGVVFLIVVDIVLVVSIVAEHLRIEKPNTATAPTTAK